MCVFCEVKDSQKLLQNEAFFMIKDIRPVSRGHCLIISKRHFESPFELNDQELPALAQIIRDAKALLDENHQPSGYNIAVNQGKSAGQTVFHFHLHLIPRYG